MIKNTDKKKKKKKILTEAQKKELLRKRREAAFRKKIRSTFTNMGFISIPTANKHFKICHIILYFSKCLAFFLI